MPAEGPGALTGTGVSPGVGHGPVHVLADSVPEPPRGARHDGDAVAERARVHAALEQVAADLTARGRSAFPEARDVLAAQTMMARDPALAEAVDALVDSGTAGARAVYESFGTYRAALVAAGGYLAGRAADLDDVRDRAVAVLSGIDLPGPPDRAGGPYVLVARDLAPADTALLSRDTVAALVTEEGGPTSHTAILARAMGVPAVVACPGATGIAEGVRALVDGTTGVVTLSPSPADIEAARTAGDARNAALAEATGPGTTADGRPVPLLANIGGPADLAAALEHDAEGVGLYRTELLFLDREDAPGEDEQYAAYREVLDAFPGGRVIVRTIDAGADKPLAFLPPPGAEPNPALGERGLRLARTHPRVLETQLAALARAADGAPARLGVMAPMVATREEAEWFAAACRTAGLPETGVMIEIPSAALRAAALAAAVDFVSIGTNDLAQYTFAADRQLGSLGALQDPWQPALLDLVHAAATGAAAGGRPCGVCGEAAGDPALACVLVGLGVTSLSMGAAALPAVRAVLARHTWAQCGQAAEAARAAGSAKEARAAARALLPGLADLAL
ncbi:phosphoenolpyruvate--protein phosphotransferase [Spongiactinospora sp. TRM90649]|uniref:phosphoenolpyruvate--protein phosphotransferase n=1 Tax=Spongiactinospora sp. TRM90649 TaxID=3031114 RepID=UPI0023F7DD2B|nr:phosphoenolpyruvate--protein phosphotransferase [Spongiactinospora sp. TRM90649]MDF5751129.1 phosphoenolpyruvate--protein phosphotransferase [Spongiactinospora sp. TRM90649]